MQLERSNSSIELLIVFHKKVRESEGSIPLNCWRKKKRTEEANYEDLVI